MLVSDSGGRRSSVRVFERLPVLAGDLLSFLGVVHFRGLDVLLFGTKVLLTILYKHITSSTRFFVVISTTPIGYRVFQYLLYITMQICFSQSSDHIVRDTLISHTELKSYF